MKPPHAPMSEVDSTDFTDERHRRDEWAEWLTRRGHNPAYYLAKPVVIQPDVVILQRVATDEDGLVIYHDDGWPRTERVEIPYAGRDDLPLHWGARAEWIVLQEASGLPDGALGGEDA